MQGDIMKVRLTLWSLFTAAAVMSTGCVSDIRSHNLPPAQQLFEPGPGVGGPGPGVLPPQSEELDVAGVVIPPPYNATLNITLIPDEDFNVVTTIGGALNGVTCADISSATINCPATVEPDLRRWATIAPTTDGN